MMEISRKSGSRKSFLISIILICKHRWIVFDWFEIVLTLFLLNSLTRHIESGIFRKMFDCLDKTAIGCARSAKIELFDSLASYVENYSGFSNLVFENFKHIFIYYGLICSLVFAAFCVHHLIKFLEKRIILLPSPLREFFPRFAPRRRVMLQRKHNVGRDSFYRFRPIRPVAHWAKHRKVFWISNFWDLFLARHFEFDFVLKI